MKKYLFSLLLILFLLLLTIPAAATSLWSDSAGDIYQDQEVEFNVGDVVTVLIDEEVEATQGATTSVSQDNSISGGTGVGILDFLNPFSYNYSDADNADGKTERTAEFEANITTLVVDKYSNGTLKIVGNKTVHINGEEQLISLSGIIRPEDIDEDDNTISSQQIANARIEFEGEGIISAKQHPNIFQRILNWIF